MKIWYKEKNKSEDVENATDSNLNKNSWIIAGAILLGSFVVSAAILLSSEKGFLSNFGQEEVSNGNKVSLEGNSEPEVPSAQKIDLDPVTSKDWVRGNRKAKISIVEYSDTECPFCKRFHSTLNKVVDDYEGKVNWVYRHAPLVQLHSKASKEAEAIECAGEQKGNEGFWAYLDLLFEKTPSNNGLDEAELPKIAQQVGLNVDRFNSCLSSGKYSAKVAESLKRAEAAGMQGTPYSIIVSGDSKTPVSGALPETSIKAMVDSLLKNN